MLTVLGLETEGRFFAVACSVLMLVVLMQDNFIRVSGDNAVLTTDNGN